MDFDNVFSDEILELYKNPHNQGTIENPDLEVRGRSRVCGDHVRFQLKIENGVIGDIKFSAYGCVVSTVSQSVLTDIVKGRAVEDVIALKQEELIKKVGKIPAFKIHCTYGLSVLKKGLQKWKQDPSVKTVENIMV